MAEIVHIVVEKGADKGMKITVPPDGARVGRSSRNDVTLNDPGLSRHHCRFFFKTGEGLWLTDLGSANGTILNDAEIQECRLSVGDAVLLGDSILRVMQADTPSSANAPVHGIPVPIPSSSADQRLAATQPLDVQVPTSVSLSDQTKISSSDPAPSVVDLGLKQSVVLTPQDKAVSNRKILYAALGLVTLLAVLAWAHNMMKNSTATPGTDPSSTSLVDEVEDLTLDIDYEKVEATPENIFRYHLRLKNNDLLIVEIDDLNNGRHVRKEKAIDPELLEELASAIKDTSFFNLEDQYSGIQPDVLDQWDMTISIGKETRRTEVINRVPPDAFESVREIVENFGKVELGLYAIQFSPEKLTQMAEDALQDGRKLYDSRDVAYGNLSEAIKRLGEADWYVETVEPKPSFYPDIVTLLKDCKFELHATYEDANFRAARAMKMRSWQEASRELRTIREMVPDRSDKRYKDANKSLLEVERRIKTGT